MITEISRNELGSHLPLYVNIYNHIKEDTGINIDELARQTIIQAGEDEKEYLLYSTKGVMGFSENSINNFMDWIVDNRLRELELERLPQTINTGDGLIKIFKSYSELNETKTNFFEGTVKNYSKQSLDMDDF
jgi:ribonucleotide reductase beta subunit family protein with ferritin-like domain